MATTVAGEEGDLATFELTQHQGIAGIAKGSGYALFVDLSEPGHRIKPAAADDSDFRLLQKNSLHGALSAAGTPGTAQR